MTTLALVGNPNSGKSTLFNALTGARQRIGNWPGVTVERRTGRCQHGGETLTVEDLPGAYGLDAVSGALDQRVLQQYLSGGEADVLVNVIDATSLARGLYLCLELLELGQPVVVALNMMDVAERRGLRIDCAALARKLGCPVTPLVAVRGKGLAALKEAAAARRDQGPTPPRPAFPSSEARYAHIDELLADCLSQAPVRRTLTDRIDAIALNRYLAFPIFLGVMYLMFLFSISLGSAFIDFFDLAGTALFVEGPRRLLDAAGLPEWAVALLADGVGGGVQLVGTFIPVIGCLFLALSFLEDSGYMGRVAFIIDRLLRALGLPGKSFVPLIVGFGCNVPAVMATRTLDNPPDRILTSIMAPFMSCGARLTVYALFAAAFFPAGGQNLVFALYLIGIFVAVASAMVVRKHLLAAPPSAFVMELPAYHMPALKSLLLQTWQRLKGFVLRAGKAIVLVVILLNLVNSIGTDGSFGNQNSEKSALSAIGKAITPVFHPMGIDEDNWPATVGIFTGIFAKEVVVGTLDALYAPGAAEEQRSLLAMLQDAAASVPRNLGALEEAATDPLGIGLGDLADTEAAAAQQEVDLNTVAAMQSLFHGEIGAFSYLLFILLYVPCAATIGVIYKEIGAFWAVFSTGWSVMAGYSAAVICYQIGTFGEDPWAAAGWLALAVALASAGFALLIHWGRRRRRTWNLIPAVQTLD